MNEIISKNGDIKLDLKLGKSIKSEYILKEIFLFLDRKRLFNLIIYNKYLQTVLKINIEDYKKISGKYRISEKDGKGKEYILNTNILIFEREYLKGKRYGKGKEYKKNGELVFEGEYLNGIKWNGKGKEYYLNGELKFDGEYLKGKRNGRGKEYYYTCELKFEGE